MDSPNNKNFIIKTFSLVFRDSLFVFLALSLFLNLLFVYYFIFLKTTTLAILFASNSLFYGLASVILTVLSSVFFGVALTLQIWQWRIRKKQNPAHVGNNLIASFMGAVATGCPVCGAFVASWLGIVGGLTAFPFQGLEVKVISLGLLSFGIWASAKSIANQEECLTCVSPAPESEASGGIKDWAGWIKKGLPELLLPALIGFSLLLFVAYMPFIADKFNFRFSFQKKSLASLSAPVNQNNSAIPVVIDSVALAQKINPAEGYEINVVYGDLGPKLLAAGAIDFAKMQSVYQEAGQPLTQEQIKILTEGSNEKIKISPENSHFLLNFLWALGLANKNSILDEGPIMKYGKDKVGNFASTGGWTLGAKPAVQLFSAFDIIALTPEQQEVLEDFAYNSYRPCCSNPTAFPDCNHGIAALALGEIMASQGASAGEIFEAFKYFNAFWFPQTYFDLAKYFLAKEGKDWSQVDGREAAGENYSTPQGWSRARSWLKSNNLLEEVSGGGGCGV